MPGLNAIAPEKLSRLVGTAACPVIVDVRDSGEGAIPASVRRSPDSVGQWGPGLRGRTAVVACAGGGDRSAAVAAWLRHEGAIAETLEGGIAAWREAGLPMLADSRLPARDSAGRTVWVTRARPKVDRIACPWLIRRFVDPEAVFLFVAPADVDGTAEHFAAAPFDVDGAYWSHRGDLCTFDVMVAELGLSGFAGLGRLATIVRGADTARPELAPQSAGLLAASLGLSRLYADDLEQLEAGMLLYDSFYRWCRDAVDETHDWVSHAPKRKGGR